MKYPEQSTYLYEDGTISMTPVHRYRGLDEVQKQARKEVMTKRGKIIKTFTLDKSKKRKIRSSCIRMFRTKTYSIKWFTLTFSAVVDQAQANKHLSMFLENLKKNYHATNYIVVKEDHLSGNPHFHCLIDIPFTDFALLNSVWCNTCSDIMPYSDCAFRTGDKKIIDTIQGVGFYISKYINKAPGQDGNKSLTRIFFISHDCISKPLKITTNQFVYLITRFKFFSEHGDYYDMYFLKDFAYLPEMIFQNEDLNRKKHPPGEPKKVKIHDSIQANLNF